MTRTAGPDVFVANDSVANFLFRNTRQADVCGRPALGAVWRSRQTDRARAGDGRRCRRLRW
jgi:hypothetical protein